MPRPADIPSTLPSTAELDAARLEDIRRRVELYGISLGILVLAMGGVLWLVITFSPDTGVPSRHAVTLISSVVLGLAIMVIPRLRRQTIRSRSLNSLVWRVTLILIAVVVSQVLGGQIIADVLTRAARSMGLSWTIGPGWPVIPFLLLAHTVASIIIPWTPLEAARPILLITILPLIEGISMGRFAQRDTLYLSALALIIAAGIPGVLIAWARQRRFAELVGLRLIGARYADVERELSTARRIHERLFPLPITTGPIRLDYRYQPMRQIGGDYLDAFAHPDGSVTVVLVDVTGHGVTAALAVNRLHGELRRVFAARGSATPAELLTALNEYIYLTLAEEQVFATAAALRLSPDGSLRFASAGHPPAFIRRASGQVDQLDPTAMMLGAAAPQDFQADHLETTISRGDWLVLYTDGAIECRNAAGRQLGVDGLAGQLRGRIPIGSTADACESLNAAVNQHRVGAADDDTLIVSLAIVQA